MSKLTKAKLWHIIHVLILINFMVQVLYGTYMVFFAVGGRRWPLLSQAMDTPVEVILRRRLYAIETWVAMVGLGLYIAVTEILPRRMRQWWRMGNQRLLQGALDFLLPDGPLSELAQRDEMVGTPEVHVPEDT